MKTQLMRSLFCAAIAATSLTFAACSGSENKQAGNASTTTETAAPESGSASEKPTFKDEKLAAAYQHYIHLKEALVASNAEEAKTGATALQTALQEVSCSEKVRTEAAKIAGSTDLAQQRQAFSTLSNEMTTLVKNDALASGNVYVAYCPMANDNQGAYWLSNEQEIRNPYFGDKMLKCGEVKETL